MVGIDNRKYILDEIRKFADVKVEYLAQEYSRQAKDIEEAAAAKLATKVDLLNQKFAKEFERIENQKRSSFELTQKKNNLALQGIVYDKAISSIKNNFTKLNKTDQTKIIQAMANTVEKQNNGIIKKYKLPKGIKLPKRTCTSTLTENKIIATASAKEQYELSLDEYIENRKVKIFNVINKNLNK